MTAPTLFLTPFLALLLALSQLLAAGTAAQAQTNNTAATDPVPGGVYVWPLPDGASEITFGERPAMIYREHAIIGIPLSQSPGSAQLTYHLNGERRQHQFSIVGKTYTEQHITLENQAMVTPPAATLSRIREEAARQRERYARRGPVENLANGFVKPLEGITTSLFGHRRFFNGQARNPHSGLDIAAPSGTPIQAPADATVTLADDLYFNGLTLFLDHGEGLITMYCHMSELIVGEGDKVVQGQVIGLVGTTGRSTGPHLHWTVSLNGTRVDPEVFLAQFSQVAAPR